MKTAIFIFLSFLSLPSAYSYPRVEVPEVLYVWVSAAQLRDWNKLQPKPDLFGPSTLEGKTLPISITEGIKAWAEPWVATQTSEYLLKLTFEKENTSSFLVSVKDKANRESSSELKKADFILIQDEDTTFQEWIILNQKKIKSFSIVSPSLVTKANLRARLRGSANFYGWNLVIN